MKTCKGRSRVFFFFSASQLFEEGGLEEGQQGYAFTCMSQSKTLIQYRVLNVCSYIYNNYRLTDDQHCLKASYISSSEGVQNKVIYSSH